MLKLCLGLSIGLICGGFSPLAIASESQADARELTVRIKGVKRGVFASISEDTTKYSPPITRCMTPCKEKIKTDKPFYITLSPPKKRYGAIRRDIRDAVVDGDTYTFDIDLDTPEIEEIRYVRSILARNIDIEKTETCKSFSKTDLTAKPSPCYRVPATMPPRSVRSGWCKMAFAVLPNGSVSNVEARECSEDMFRIPSIERVKTYRYYPQLKEGKVVQSRIKSTIRYTLRNGKGEIIPARGEK